MISFIRSLSPVAAPISRLKRGGGNITNLLLCNGPAHLLTRDTPRRYKLRHVSFMLNPQKALEREALPRRHRELEAEIA